MISKIKVILLYIFLSLSAEAIEKYHQFTDTLIGKDIAPENDSYNEMIAESSSSFYSNFTFPIASFSRDYIKVSGKTLFYPFAGADISYPLLLFPHLEQFVLVGLEFAGNPSFLDKKFDLNKFYPQAEGYLKSGFFKTMNMSAQMAYEQGVIPMLVLQIGLFGGNVNNIEIVEKPYRGIAINFIYRGEIKKLYYFKANIDDSTDKTSFFEFLTSNKLIDNCMLKASSYKLHQPEFKQLLSFILDNCPNILQDDTGVPVKKLLKQNRKIDLFGNYIIPYGSEFKPYYQPELAKLYLDLKNKPYLNFCYGYGCGIVEANILLAKNNVLK